MCFWNFGMDRIPNGCADNDLGDCKWKANGGQLQTDPPYFAGLEKNFASNSRLPSSR